MGFSHGLNWPDAFDLWEVMGGWIFWEVSSPLHPEVHPPSPTLAPHAPRLHPPLAARLSRARFHHWREIDIEVTGDRKNSVTWDISSDELNDLGSLGMNQSIFLKQSPWISETNTCNRVQVTTNVLSADNTEWWSPRIAASREAYVGGAWVEDRRSQEALKRDRCSPQKHLEHRF